MGKVSRLSEKKSENKESMKNQGIKFNKEFGQHILKNPLVINDIVSRVNFIINISRQQ
jgi:hypothetical protein